MPNSPCSLPPPYWTVSPTTVSAGASIISRRPTAVLDRLHLITSVMNALDAVSLPKGYSDAEAISAAPRSATDWRPDAGIHPRWEHYLRDIGPACLRGVPIRDPISRRIVGFWISRAGPGSMIRAVAWPRRRPPDRGRMRALASSERDGDTRGYWSQARRFQLGVLAMGGNVC